MNQLNTIINISNIQSAFELRRRGYLINIVEENSTIEKSLFSHFDEEDEKSIKAVLHKEEDYIDFNNVANLQIIKGESHE